MCKLLKNKYYLYITELFAGMSVMIIVFSAGLMFWPPLSIYYMMQGDISGVFIDNFVPIVLAIIIGTVMVAVTLGNVYGERRANKNPNLNRLYIRIILAAVWLALAPIVQLGRSVLLSAYNVDTNFVVTGFIDCIVSFVIPLFLLGTVTPSLINYSSNNFDDSEKTVSTLNIYNKIGCIIGTALSVIVIVYVDEPSIVYWVLSAGILLVISIVYFVVCRKKQLQEVQQ